MVTVPTSQDFEDGPLTDLGIDVIRTPITVREDNDTGDQIETEGTPVTIKAVIRNVRTKYEFQFEGQVRQADAKLFVLPTVTVNKRDKITANGKDYKIFSVDLRKFGENTIHQSCIMFEI